MDHVAQVEKWEKIWNILGNKFVLAYFEFLAVSFSLKNYLISKNFTAMDFQSMIPYIYSITTDWRKELQSIPLEEAFYYLQYQNFDKTRVLNFWNENFS